MASIIAVCQSEKKGIKKQPVAEVTIREDYGVVGDAHADCLTHRQVSLLAIESVNKMRDKGLDLSPGDFAENITTEGIDLGALKVGSKLRLGADVEIEITQLGKKCHGRCKIFERLGDCVMPREGVFARVTAAGSIKAGDPIEVITNGD